MPTEVKQKIKKLRFVINVRNYIRTKKILSGRTGQIKLQSPRGSLIYDFIIKNDIENVLDIGTWNGLGSTTILYNALKVKKKPFRLLSIETDKIAYKNAKKNLKDKSEISLLLGRIIEIDELPSPKSIDFEKHNLDSKNVEWFYQDVRRYKKTKNIFPALDSEYDFILFDGGEFSTFAEFKKLYERTKYFGLDDVETYKQYEVLKFINTHKKEFELINSVKGLSIYKTNT